MKRTTLTASLVGSAAAGLIAAAIATPAFAQATTYPDGTDCSAIQNSTNRQDCVTQQNESRQNTNPGDNLQQPGDPAGAAGAAPGAAQPAAPGAPAGAGGTTGTNNTGSGTTGGTPGGTPNGGGTPTTP